MEAVHYTVSDLIDLLKMSLSTINRRVNKKRLPKPLEISGKNVWPKRLINTYVDLLERGRTEAEATAEAAQAMQEPVELAVPTLSQQQLDYLSASIEEHLPSRTAKRVAADIEPVLRSTLKEELQSLKEVAGIAGAIDRIDEHFRSKMEFHDGDVKRIILRPYTVLDPAAHTPHGHFCMVREVKQRGKSLRLEFFVTPQELAMIMQAEDKDAAILELAAAGQRQASQEVAQVLGADTPFVGRSIGAG